MRAWPSPPPRGTVLDPGHRSLASRILVPPCRCESLRSAALLLPGPPTQEHPQVDRQPRSTRRPGGLAGSAQGSGAHTSPSSASRTQTSQTSQRNRRWERAPGRESPHPGPEALTDQQAQHVQQHEDPPPLHVAPAQGRPRPPLVPAVPARPDSPKITWPWRVPGPGKGLGLTEGPGRGGGGAGGGRGVERNCGDGRAGEGGGPEGCVCHLDPGVEGPGLRCWERSQDKLKS